MAIRKVKKIEATVVPRKVFTPYAYQQYCIDAIMRLPRLGLFLDMGLGKTVITLTALHELKYHRFCVRKALVIAPKKVAETTWRKEAAKWEHLRDLRVVSVLGTATQRKKALDQAADLYVINRENTQWLVQYYGRNWPFDMVILDESSSFKNHQAKRFKALKSILAKIVRVVELTGTPRPKSLIDLWAQIYLLDGGQRLGRTISCYREMYFDPDKRNATTIFSYAPKAGAEDAILQSISDICISMKSEDYLDLPELIFEEIPVVLDGPAQARYTELEREALLQVDDEVITAGSAAVLSGKLLQLCNGAVYDEDGNAVLVHDCKMEAFLETLEQLNGQHALVYYNYQHDKDRLLEALAKTPYHTEVYTDAKSEDDWNAGRIDVLLAHPASCGYGLNLQEGGHHVIWFGLPNCDLEQFQQANKRLHRNGQPYPVIIHMLVVQGGRDEDVIKSLNEKDAGQERLLDALKARIKKAKEAV